MSNAFTLRPIDTEARKWLREAKVKVPRGLPDSRFATPADLRRVVTGLSAFIAICSPAAPEVGLRWSITLRSRKKPKTGPHAFIEVLAFPGEDGPLPHVYFESGWPMAVATVAVELAKATGPLLLDGEDVYGPHVVTDDSDALALAAAMAANAAGAFDKAEGEG